MNAECVSRNGQEASFRRRSVKGGLRQALWFDAATRPGKGVAEGYSRLQAVANQIQDAKRAQVRDPYAVLICDLDEKPVSAVANNPKEASILLDEVVVFIADQHQEVLDPACVEKAFEDNLTHATTLKEDLLDPKKKPKAKQRITQWVKAVTEDTRPLVRSMQEKVYSPSQA